MPDCLCSSACPDAPSPVSSPSRLALADSSLPPLRTFPDPAVSLPRCRRSPAFPDALSLASSPFRPALADSSLPPLRTFPDSTASTPDCSCWPACLNVPHPVLSYTLPKLVGPFLRLRCSFLCHVHTKQ